MTEPHPAPSSPLRVCWLQEKRGAFGGAEANVVETALALRSRGFENILLHHENSGRDEARWDRAFSQSIRLEPGESAAARVAQIKPRLIWIHNWSRSDDFGGLGSLGIPRARMIHDHAMYCLRHYKYHPLTRRNCTRPASLACIFPCLAPLQRGAGRWPIRLASFPAKLREIADNRSLDRLLVNSRFMQDELLKNGFAPEQIEILPPIPPERDLPSAVKETLALPGRLLFAGQVIRGKGLDHLLLALRDVAADWHLRVAGYGSALNACRRLAKKLQIEDRISWVGHLSPMELAHEYRQASIIVVPSVWQEPFGMIGIEAMRHGRPVVAYANGGIPEWMQDRVHGRLVPPGDKKALGMAISELLQNPTEAAACGARGEQWVTQNFAFDDYIDKLADTLGRLAGVAGDYNDG